MGIDREWGMVDEQSPAPNGMVPKLAFIVVGAFDLRISRSGKSLVRMFIFRSVAGTAKKRVEKLGL